jgi:hypothetical protein
MLSFNPGGETSRTINNRVLTIDTDYFTTVAKTLILLGENIPVESSALLRLDSRKKVLPDTFFLF